MTQYWVWGSIVCVYNTTVKLKPNFLTFSDTAELAAKATRILEDDKIPQLSLAIDATLIKFEEAPRGIPTHIHRKEMSRKRMNFDSFN